MILPKNEIPIGQTHVFMKYIGNYFIQSGDKKRYSLFIDQDFGLLSVYGPTRYKKNVCYIITITMSEAEPISNNGDYCIEEYHVTCQFKVAGNPLSGPQRRASIDFINTFDGDHNLEYT